jgi:hypothetical protein
MPKKRTLSRSVGQNETTTTGGMRPEPLHPADCAVLKQRATQNSKFSDSAGVN